MMQFIIYLNVFFIGANSFLAGECFHKRQRGLGLLNLSAAAFNAAVVMIHLS